MKIIYKFLLVILALLAMGGCATGLDKNATAVDWTKGSIVVMSVEVTNQYKSNYQPTGLGVVMRKKSSTEARDWIPVFGQVKAGTNAVLVTKQIQPGKYTISKIYGMSQKFLISGRIDFSVDAPFEVTANSIIYLGRVMAINKERTNKDDQYAGGVIPLIDQAVSGFGGGTLEVSLGDNYAEDINSLKNEFAFLQKLDVIRTPLQKMMLERTTGSSAAPIEVRPTPPVVATPTAQLLPATEVK